MDPQTLSLNTTRGKAMHAVVAYAWWLYKGLPESEAAQGFATMPEVTKVLEAHLEPNREPSLAIRSVYGQWFPRLFALDRQWAVKNAERIFPSSETELKKWEAAWAAYLASWGVYVELFHALREQYALAVERLDNPLQLKRTLADPKEQLAAHLMGLFWSGRLSTEDSLFARFWLKAPAEIRRSALAVVGRWLHAPNQEFDKDLLERLASFWEFRLDAAKANQNPSERSIEMTAFGLWFGSGKFDDGWAIAQFAESLELILPKEMKANGAREEVVVRLVKLAEPFSLQTVKCLRRLIDADRAGWEVRIYEKQFLAILSAALRRGGEAAATAESVVNDLWARGYRQYGALLNAPA